jgi:type VI protein secretion system component VasF
MTESRRRLLMMLVGAVGCLTVEPVLSRPPMQTRPLPTPHPYPNGRDPNAAPGNDEPSRLNRAAIEEENLRRLRADAAKLYEMAGDLKTEVERTDPHATLSVSLIKKTQEIEKLAKQIRGLAKGLS